MTTPQLLLTIAVAIILIPPWAWGAYQGLSFSKYLVEERESSGSIVMEMIVFAFVGAWCSIPLLVTAALLSQ